MSLFIKRLNKYQKVDSVSLANHVKVSNFNQNVSLEGIDYLIIGTLTPCSGRNPNDYNEGFFYCGDENWMYKLIDNVFEGNEEGELVKAKKAYKTKWGKPIEIKNILKKRGIAFLDIVKEAIVHIDDPSDDSICPFVLDYKTFNTKKEIINKLLIEGKAVANSRNAAEAFKQITDKDIPVIPQRTTGRTVKDIITGNSYKTKDEIKEGWKRFFRGELLK